MHPLFPLFPRRFAVFAVIMAIFLLVGCANLNPSTNASSGSPSLSGPPPTSTPTQSLPTPKPTITNLSDYCNLVSLAEVSQATGLAITQVTPLPNQARQQVICGYAADVTAGTGAAIVFNVGSTAGQTQTIFNALEQQAQSKGATVTNLSGIGESAFAANQNGTDSVTVLKGSVVFSTGGTTPHPLPLAADKQLAELIASKL